MKGTSKNSKFVTPVKTGVQSYQGLLDSGFRRNDIFRGGLKFQLNLRHRLTLAFVSISLIVLIGIGVFGYYHGRKALYDATVSNLLGVAAEKEAALNHWISDLRLDITNLTVSPRITEAVRALAEGSTIAPKTPEAHDRLVSELLPFSGRDDRFTKLFIIEAKSAKIIVSTDAKDEGKFREDRAYFIEGLKGPYIQNPYFSIDSEEPLMNVSAPIQTAEGKVLGVLVGNANLSQFKEIIHLRTGDHQTHDAFLVNKSNLFVTQPRYVSDQAVLRRGVHTEAVRRALSGERGVLLGDDYRGVPGVISYRWLPERQLGLIVKIDQNEAFAPIKKFRNIIILAGGVVFILALGVALVLSRTITQPIFLLKEGAERLSRGERNVQLPEVGNDELGILAREFNQMATAISDKEAQLHLHSNQLEEVNKELKNEITERKQAEEALKQRTVELEAVNKELEAFSYSVSHDLRAPLRAIDGFSGMILEDYFDKLDDEGKRLLGVIQKNTQKMSQLIDDLLVFARFGKQEIRLSDIDMEKLGRNVVEELKPIVSERRIQFNLNGLPSAQGDQAMVRQVIINLLSNAIKFTRHRETAIIDVGGSSKGNENIYYVKLIFYSCKNNIVLFQAHRGAQNGLGTTDCSLKDLQRIMTFLESWEG